MNYIPGFGNPNSKLLLLGECPYPDENRAFESKSHRETFSLLREVGINLDSLWKTYVSKFYVPPNLKSGRKIPFKVRAKAVGVDVDTQLAELQNEINSVGPNCILAIGSTALWATTGKSSISDYRGSILAGMGCKVVASYNPNQLSWNEVAEFRGYWNRSVMGLDFRRAKEQSLFSGINRPNRTLSICRSSYQLAEFIKRYKNYTKPAVDIEARGQCIPFCIGIAFTPNEGIAIPLWNKGEIESIMNLSNSEMVQLWILINEILSNNDIIGQNFKYDQDKLIRLGFTIRNLFSDTLLKAFAINPELPKNLAFNTSIYTEEPFYKNEGMYEGKLEDLLIGCARDACVTKEIDLRMEDDLALINQQEYYYNFIMHLHQFYSDIENEGFNINQDTKTKLFEKYCRWSEQLSYELYQIVGDYVNVQSPKQVSILLYENFRIPRKKGTSEEDLTDILNSQSLKLSSEKRRAIEIVLEKRRVDKSIGNYLTALPDYDGRMKTTFFPCLETGRSSTAQLGPPIRPALELKDEKGKKKLKLIGTAFQTMTKHGDIGQDIRSQYEPDKGYVFLQADSAQAEARVVFLLAEDYQALEDIDTHDYHALTASWFFGGSEDDYSKKKLGCECPIRFAGKTLRHAGHLGAGKRRAATSVNTDARKYNININITEAIADKALKIFHMKQPKIREVFHNGIITCLSRDRYLTSSVPYAINATFGGKRQFFEKWEDELFRQAFSYIPQRSVTDNTKAAGLRLKKREPKLTRIILESHDALLFMVPEREVDYFGPIIKEEMERPINFENCSLPRQDLVIPCELEIGYNYQELKKFKYNTHTGVNQ